MAIRKRSMLAVALVAGFAVAIPACSSNDDKGGKTAESNTGSIGLNLVVGGLQLNTVSLTIENTSLLGSAINRTINVASNQATVSAFVGGLPVGAGYTVRLTATAADGTTCDSGLVPLTVLANQTTGVTVPIACGTTTAAPTRGNVRINGEVTVAPQCAYLTQVYAAPLQVGVGETIDVSAIASKSTGVGFAWTATAGTFASASSANTSYTCVAGGEQTLTISLSSATGCAPDVIQAVVNCVGGPVCGNGVVETGEDCDPPATGTCSSTCQTITGGSGGATSGGASSGGATSGGATSGGATSGGASSGGATSGGATSGGATSGGASSGGATSGGATSGGASSGGATSGGATSGGASSGGASSGGAPNACTTCQNTSCPGPVAAVANLCAATNTAGTALRPLCDAYETCLRTTSCANAATDLDGNPDPRFCYCGNIAGEFNIDACFASTATPTTPQGACRDVFANLAAAVMTPPSTSAPAPATVSAMFFDLSTAFGAEGQLMSCTQVQFCNSAGVCSP